MTSLGLEILFAAQPALETGHLAAHLLKQTVAPQNLEQGLRDLAPSLAAGLVSTHQLDGDRRPVPQPRGVPLARGCHRQRLAFERCEARR